MACTGDSVVLLFSENYEIHVLKTKRRSLLQMVWAVLGLRFTLNSLRMIGCIFCLFFKLHIVFSFTLDLKNIFHRFILVPSFFSIICWTGKISS